MEHNRELIEQLKSRGMDPEILIKEILIGYKSSKEKDPAVPINIIRFFYSLQLDEVTFDSIKKSFIKRYVENESNLESVHNKEEKAGLKKMYEYIHSDDINYMFDIYTLKFVHEALYSCTPYPEFGGTFRNVDVYLPGTGIGLCEWPMIRTELEKLNPEVLRLHEWGKVLRETIDTDALFEYLDSCVELKCKLIKIHPFMDGNGRSVRGFINKLLEDAGLPPVYIKAKERTEYQTAMNLANGEGDYTKIKEFYRYKVCDSIVELYLDNHSKKKVESTEEVLESTEEEKKLVLKK